MKITMKRRPLLVNRKKIIKQTWKIQSRTKSALVKKKCFLRRILLLCDISFRFYFKKWISWYFIDWWRHLRRSSQFSTRWQQEKRESSKNSQSQLRDEKVEDFSQLLCARRYHSIIWGRFQKRRKLPISTQVSWSSRTSCLTSCLA